MKFNDDSLMLFDLDNNNLDYDNYETINNNYTNQFVEFTCDDLDQFSNLNTIKTCTSLIDEIDLFDTNETDINAELDNEFYDFTDTLFASNNSSLNFNSTINTSISSSISSSINASLNSLINNQTNETNSPIEINQDKRDVKKNLLDNLVNLTQRKLSHTLCFDNKLRKEVLLKSALKNASHISKNVNLINEDNLLGTKSKLDFSEKQDRYDGEFKQTKELDQLSNDKFKEQDLIKSSLMPRKRNFKSNSSNLLSDKEMLEEKTKIKKQKLSHLHDLNENNEELNNLANCFIKLKTRAF